MNAVDRFAALAVSFHRWATDEAGAGEIAARQALTHLAELFAAALALPPVDADTADSPRVSDDEWQRVFQACRRLPVQYYGEIFDPLALLPGELGVGDVADDIADIYRDVVTGLRAYQHGHIAEAVWQWRFTFWSHWGQHAVGVIGALRAWVEANSACG